MDDIPNEAEVANALSTTRLLQVQLGRAAKELVELAKRARAKRRHPKRDEGSSFQLRGNLSSEFLANSLDMLRGNLDILIESVEAWPRIACIRCSKPLNWAACHHCPADTIQPCIRCKHLTTIGIMRFNMCPECFAIMTKSMHIGVIFGETDKGT